MSQRPIAIGMLLCEHAIIEEGTKNVTSVNCFSKRTGDAFPWTSPPFTVLAWLTDGKGEFTLELVVEDAVSMEHLYKDSRKYRLASQTQEGRLLIRLHKFKFPHPGQYRFLILADNELLAQRTLTLVSSGVDP